VESSIGAGLMLGPVVGQIIFSLLGFEFTFYCTALIQAVPSLLQLVFLPNRLNKFRDEKPTNTDDTKIDQEGEK
jgi:predicted MFS family arabinose efflux permease